MAAILLSARPGNAPAFLLGWIIGILTIGPIVLSIPGIDTERGEPTLLSGWVRMLIGAALFALAFLQLRRKKSVSDSIEMPKALSNLDSNNAGRTAVLGFLLSTINPKNLLLTFSGAVSIDTAMATSFLAGHRVGCILCGRKSEHWDSCHCLFRIFEASRDGAR